MGITGPVHYGVIGLSLMENSQFVRSVAKGSRYISVLNFQINMFSPHFGAFFEVGLSENAGSTSIVSYNNYKWAHLYGDPNLWGSVL